MTEAQRKILLDALDLLREMQPPKGNTSGSYIDRAVWALQDVLQCGPDWQEDGE